MNKIIFLSIFRRRLPLIKYLIFQRNRCSLAEAASRLVFISFYIFNLARNQHHLVAQQRFLTLSLPPYSRIFFFFFDLGIFYFRIRHQRRAFFFFRTSPPVFRWKKGRELLPFTNANQIKIFLGSRVRRCMHLKNCLLWFGKRPFTCTCCCECLCIHRW